MRTPRCALALVLMGLGCGKTAPAPARPVAPARTAPRKLAIAALDAAKVASVPPGTSGPYLGLGSEGGMVVWVEPQSGKLGSWRARPLGRDGVPIGTVLRVADAPPRVGLVAVKPAGPLTEPKNPQASDGFLVVSTEERGEYSAIQAMQLNAKGELIGGPLLVEEKARAVLWIDAIPTRHGTLLLWAKRTGKTAEVDAMEFEGRLARRQPPQIVARDVLAWQVAADGGGVATAYVAVVSAARGPTGTVTVLPIDSNGKTQGTPISVSASPTANPDLDMTRIGDRLVLAWSDVRSGESAVYLAALDRGGALRTPPQPATGSTDEEALLRLVGTPPPSTVGYLIWEDLTERPDQGRAFRVAPLGAAASLGSTRGELLMDEVEQVPELGASLGGLGALTLAPLCRRGKHCAEAESVPTFVQFDSELKLVGSEPMRLNALDGAVARSAWALGCWSDRCVALAVAPSSPAPVFAVRLAPRSDAWQAAGGSLTPSGPPRATELETLTTVDPPSRVAAVRTQHGSALAWTARLDLASAPADAKKAAALGERSTVEVQFWPEAQTDPLPIQTVSREAGALGGVALAPANAAKDEVLVAWSGVDRQQKPEVFCTLLSAATKKPQARALTHNRAEVNDLALTHVQDGWLVGWIDARRGDPEVYVIKVNQRLEKVGTEKRITNARGAATGLRLLTRDSRTFAVWADARDATRPGWSDIYGVWLNNSDGSPAGEPRPLVTTVPHSHSPALAAVDEGLLVAFIEEGGEHQPEGAHLELLRLDPEGKPTGTPVSVRPASGTPTSLALDCAGQNCKVTFAVDQGARSELEAFSYVPAETPQPKRITWLGGAGGQTVPMHLMGRELLYADMAPDRRGRIRRMSLEW